MRIVSLLLLSIHLFGGSLFENISTFQADFRQVVTSDNTNIVYQGEIYIKKPNLLFWKYQAPVRKLVYILNSRLFIVEPDLEQVIIRNISKIDRFIEILNQSKKVSENRYIANIDNREYLITLHNEKLHRIIYNDELDNRVEITFSNIQTNIELENSIFTPQIGEEFDRVYQ